MSEVPAYIAGEEDLAAIPDPNVTGKLVGEIVEELPDGDR